MSIYDFTAQTLSGETLNFAEHLKGKVTLITNVASCWGETALHYKRLVELHTKFGSAGLCILAFPCNQFEKEEPGNPEEISAFVSKRGVQFQMMAKVDVNGPEAHPVWQFLKSCGGMQDVSWNFSAYFLIDSAGAIKTYNLRPNGNEIGYDLPGTLLKDLEDAILVLASGKANGLTQPSIP